MNLIATWSYFGCYSHFRKPPNTALQNLLKIFTGTKKAVRVIRWLQKAKAHLNGSSGVWLDQVVAVNPEKLWWMVMKRRIHY